MVQILFIVNDERVDRVIPALEQEMRMRVTVAGDFDEGLRLIFEKRPAIVFVQHEIGGHSCIAVIEHVKNLLRDSSPRMVVIVNEGRRLVAGRDLFNDLVTVGDDPSRVLDDLRRVVRESGLIELAPILSSSVGKNPFEADSGEGDVDFSTREITPPLEGYETTGEALASTSQHEGVRFDQDLSGPASPEPFTISSPAGGGSAEGRGGGQRDLESHSLGGADLPGTIRSEELHDPAVERDHQEFPPYDQIFSLRKRSRSSPWKIWAIAGGTLLIVVVAGGYVLFAPARSTTSKPPPLSPAAEIASPQAKTDVVVSLPPELENAPVDRDASSRRPGWEIRRTASVEVRIMREEGRLKGVQVLATTPEGLPQRLVDDILTAAGGGFGGSRDSRIDEGITLEVRRNGRGVEAGIYRRKEIPAPLAVILAVP